MVKTIEEKIIETSDEILNILLEYRKRNPEFTFSLRQRDSPQSKEKRLEKGFWFQGSNYIYVPLFRKGDNNRKIKTIGFVIGLGDKNKISNYIEISFKAGSNDIEKAFHNELASVYSIALDKNNVGYYSFSDNDYVKNIEFYLGSFRDKALELLDKYSLKSQFEISEKQFNKALDKVLEIKDKLKMVTQEKTDIIEAFSSQKSDMKLPLNQILYGPPGTGKTYNTINKAISIANPEFDLEQKRKIIKNEYERLEKNGQIAFCTFHQSMSYEDFIEGIKPILDQEKDLSNEIRYKIVSGVFKTCCAKSAYNCYKVLKKNESAGQEYNFDELYEAFLDYNRDSDLTKTYSSISGKLTEIFEINKNDSIRARAKGSTASHVAPLTKENLQKLYDEFADVKLIQNLQIIKDTVGISPRLTEFYAIFKGLKDFEKNNYKRTKELDSEVIVIDLEEEEIIKKFEAGVFNNATKLYGNIADPLILIIDEINRGNVSQIFGELITLIEEDKRFGNKEELQIMLPYSKEKFGVPANLFIIGTMNTADRSVEALDSALRRRFVFEEMPPLYDLDELQNEVFGFKLADILKRINLRIEKLLDDDHAIGHAYFINKDENAMITSFYKNIIPLLKEYFFGDHGKIGLVLGNGFVQKTENDSVFADFEYDGKDQYDEKESYTIIDHSDNKDAFEIALSELMK